MSNYYAFNPNNRHLTGARPATMFSIQSLNGGATIWLPNPEKDSGKFLVATLVDSARNTAGVVTAQKICRDQDKIELSWSLLTVEEWEQLLAFWDSNFEFLVNYYSPVKHQRLSRVFYIGDRSSSFLDIDENNLPTAYKDCTANIIDTGLSN